MTNTVASPVNSEFRTRKPSGKPPWPMMLLAGVEKAGKSYAAAAFSATDLVDRTFWVEIGEGAADQYGAIPGARYEIVEHDGTYRSIGRAIQAAIRQPRPDGKPHAIVIDSMTELWDLLADEAQSIAMRRAREKAEKAKKPVPEEAQITMDLWNRAKKRWRDIIDLLRSHDGPVILTTRLESVTVMDGDKPTREKEWKIRAEKNFPFECDTIVRLTAPQKADLVGVRSLNIKIPPGKSLPLPEFSIDGLLRKLGLGEEGATAPRVYTPPAVAVQPPAQRTATTRQGPVRQTVHEPKTYDQYLADILNTNNLDDLQKIGDALKHNGVGITPEQRDMLRKMWFARREDITAGKDLGEREEDQA